MNVWRLRICPQQHTRDIILFQPFKDMKFFILVFGGAKNNLVAVCADFLFRAAQHQEMIFRVNAACDKGDQTTR